MSSGLLVAACAGVIPLGCSSGLAPSEGEDVGSASEALTATFSGTITDANSNPLSNVSVALSGATQATTSTNAAGQYSFNVSIPQGSGSWAIQPTRGGCTFNPTVVNLNGVTGSRSGVNFTGTGTSCIGTVTAKGKDPGPRGGTAGAGGCLSFTGPNAAALTTLCNQAILRFQEVDSVSGTIAGETGVGLGPVFNGNSCAMCHAEPSVLGSSPGLNSALKPVNNPQVALANLDGATNTVPFFITNAGPVREARFPNSGGGVFDLYTIAGRSDTPSTCTPTQPNFTAASQAGNLIFRIPTPTFGLGLIENISDATLTANVTASTSTSLGIAGTLNHTGNDGTVTRFGWKAQNKSLLIFAGEAYNVEQGVSNENFENERAGGASNTTGCFGITGTPEDNTNPAGTGSVSDVNSDLINFAMAMRLSAPAAPSSTGIPGNPTAASLADGQSLFSSIGCGNCHTPTLVTDATSAIDPALAGQTIHPYSDFALHSMGALADNVPQGNATGSQFRSAPLWGVGQRLFFLHDGRTSDLGAAIEAHSSGGSEANVVIGNFNGLSQTQQQDLLNFLRSL